MEPGLIFFGILAICLLVIFTTKKDMNTPYSPATPYDKQGKSIKELVLVGVMTEAAFNALVQSSAASKGIQIAMNGPFQYGTHLGDRDKLNRIIDNTWKIVLPVFAKSLLEKEMISEMLNNIQAWDRKYATYINEIEREIGYGLTKMAMEKVKKHYK